MKLFINLRSTVLNNLYLYKLKELLNFYLMIYRNLELSLHIRRYKKLMYIFIQFFFLIKLILTYDVSMNYINRKLSSSIFQIYS